MKIIIAEDDALSRRLLETHLLRWGHEIHGFDDGVPALEAIRQAGEPTLAILDETDSGLDIDALQVVARGVNVLRSPERAIILVTHYQRLLDFIIPGFVHVLLDGRIVKSGGKELALELEGKGYDWIIHGAQVSV